MITRIQYILATAFLFCQLVACLTINTNESSSFPTASLSATSTSLNYAIGDEQATDSFRNSVRESYRRQEPLVSVAQLLTEQVAREFTSGRRYLLAAAAVKQVSADFYLIEEQQRVRAMELIEYARVHNIQLLDYASQVEKTPIDRSLETAELVKEILSQERRDIQLLEQAISQVSSTNTELFAFFQTIRADQMDRQDHIMNTLSHVVDTTTSIATAHVSSGELSSKMADEFMARIEGLGQNFHDFVSKSSHISCTGATAATVAAVDAVDPDSLPSTDDILEALPMEDILQVMDSAATLLEEPSQLVDSIQQGLMETEAVSQIVDIVSGLY